MTPDEVGALIRQIQRSCPYFQVRDRDRSRADEAFEPYSMAEATEALREWVHWHGVGEAPTIAEVAERCRRLVARRTRLARTGELLGAEAVPRSSRGRAP